MTRMNCVQLHNPSEAKTTISLIYTIVKVVYSYDYLLYNLIKFNYPYYDVI